MTSKSWLHSLRRFITGRRPGETARRLPRNRVRASLLERFEERITPAVTATWDSGLSTLFVDSTGGDSVTIADSGGTVTVDDDGSGVTITNGAPSASAVVQIQMVTSAGASTIDLSGIDTAVYTVLTDVGVNYDLTLDTDIGGGTNKIKTSNDAFAFNISGAGSGYALASYFVSYFDATDFTAGTGNDTFNFFTGGSLSGGIDAGKGSDKLSYSTYGSAVSIHMNSSGNTGIAGSITGFEAADGSSNADSFYSEFPQGTAITFDGRDGNDTYSLDYTVGGTDDITISDTGGGNSGNGDRLDFSGTAFGVTVDLDGISKQAVDKATNYLTIASVIESATGTSFADDFTVDAGWFSSPNRNLDGGAPAVGDKLTVGDISGGGGVVSLGQYASHKGALVTFTGFETVNLALSDSVTFNGTAGDDSLSLNTAAWVLDMDVNGSPTTYSGTFGTVTNLEFDALGGDDTLAVDSAFTVTGGDFKSDNLEVAELNAPVNAALIQGDAGSALVASTGQIQDSVDMTKSAATISIAAGSYTDDRQIEIYHSATVLGPNAGVAGYGARGPEAVIYPFDSDPDPNSAGSHTIVYVSADSVTFKGMTIDGDNPLLVSGVVHNGADVDAIEGISSYEGVGDITVQNNIIKNLTYFAVDFYNYFDTSATSNNLIDSNLLTNLGGGGFFWGGGVLVYNNFYADVTNNKITDARIGVQTGNFEKVNPGSTGSISDNTISVTRRGIYHNLHYSNASALTLDSNTITAINDIAETRWDGIMLSSFQTAVDAVVTDNIIDGTGANGTVSGYEVWNTPTTAVITITGGSVTGVQRGVWATNHDPLFDFPDATSTKVEVSGVDISASVYGVFVEDSAANSNNATVSVTINSDTDISTNKATGVGVFVSGSDASALVDANDNSISGNFIGIDVNGGSATISSNHIFNNATGVRFTNGGTGSLSNNNFNDAIDNGTDVRLDSTAGAVTIAAASNNAFAGDDYYIDNRAAQAFNLVGTGSTFDQASNFRIEDRMYHKQDNLASGLTTWVAANRYVTAPGSQSGATTDTDSSIQGGIDAANGSDTVNVEAGSYNQTANVNKTLTLLGAAAHASIMAPTTGAQQTILRIDATNVTVDGMAFQVNQNDDGGLGGLAPIAPVAIAAVGPAPGFVTDFNGLTLKNNTITSIGDNTFADWTGSPGLTVRAAGIVLYDSPGGGIPTVTIQDNDVDVLSGTKFHQRAVWLAQLKTTFTGNTLKGAGNDLLFQFASGGASLIDDNDFNGVHWFDGGGLVIADPNGLSPITVSNNRFTPTAVPGITSNGLQVNFNTSGATSPISITGNTFTGDVIGIYLGSQTNTTVDGNTFTPAAGLPVDANLAGDDFAHVIVNSLAPSGFTPGLLNSAAIKNNIFNTAAGSKGSAVVVANTAATTFGTVTIGGAGDENTYQAGFTRGVRQTGGNTAITDEISGATTGVEVTGGTATLTNSHLFANTTGVKFATGGTGSLTGTDFDGGGSADNGTDLRLDSGAGAVTIAAASNNAFAGDTYYIDNQSAQAFNLLGTGSTYEYGAGLLRNTGTLSDNFRIEDLMFHKLDAGTSGLTRWVASNLYVTTPGTGASDETIQRGVNAAAGGDTINVEAGSYGEDVNMNSNPVAMTVLGAGAGTTSIIGQLGGANETVLIDSNQILDGFTVTRVLGVGENNIGVTNVSGSTGAIMRNNILTNNRTAVYVNGSGGNFTIHRNVIDDNRTGILFADLAQGAHTITENAITNNRTFGVLFLDSITSVNSGLIITGNRITGNFATQLENGSTVVINASGNFWGQASPANTAPPVLGSKINGTLPPVFNYPGPASPPGLPYPYTITGSSGVDYTPWLTSGTDSNGGTPGFQSDYAVVAVDTVSPQTGASGRINEGISLAASGGTVNILSGTYTEDIDGTLNAINLAPGSSPGQVILVGNMTLTGNDTLTMEVNGTNPASAFDNFVVTGGVTLGGANLVLSLGYVPAPGDFYKLIDNDLADLNTGGLAAPYNVDGATFMLGGFPFKLFHNGGDGNDLTLMYAPTPTITYAEDTAWSLFTPGTFIADADSVTAGNQPATYGYDAFSTIQAAVDAVAANGTVRVNDGTYNEDVNLNKTVALLGAGPGSAIIVGAKGGPDGATVRIAANNLEVAGFTITRDGNTVADWNDPSLNFAGVAVIGQALTGALIHDNLIYGNRTGIDINNSNGHTIRNNVIDNNNTGMLLRNQTDNLIVVENSITNNRTNGVVFIDASSGSNVPVQQALNCTFSNNNISGNWYGGIVDRQIGGSLPAPGTNPKNFSGNWFGTTTPVTSVALSADPGYASLIPVVFGGLAVPPVAPQPDVLGPASANFDISPFLHFGTDTDAGEYGFQGDFSWLHVTPFGTQTQAAGRIQEAIDLIADGALTGANRTVTVLGGNYVDNVTVNKSLKVIGPNVGIAGYGARGAEAVVIAGAVADALIDVSADSVTIDGLTIDGADLAVRDVRVNEVNDVTVQNNIIKQAERGVQYNGVTVGGNTGGVMTKNLIEDMTAGTSYGFLGFDASYVAVTLNEMSDLSVGMFEQYYYYANGGLNPNNVISDNTITADLLGYGTNERGASAATTALSNNTYNIDAGGVGIQLYNIYKSSGITMTNETVIGGAIGVYAFISGGSASITGSSFTGSGAGSIGVHLTNYLTDFSYPATGDGSVTIDGTSIDGYNTGVMVDDDVLGAFKVTATIQNDSDITGASVAGVLVSGADASASILNNDNSISGNAIGIDVNGGSATITTNHIYNNTTGVRFTAGGTGSLSNNNFNDAIDNGTDVRLDSTAGAVTIGAASNNAFAGDTYYIDNRAAQAFNLVGTGSTYEAYNTAVLVDNFRIEDRMYHALDDAASGRITVVAANRYVTAPGTGASDETIQRGINAADANDTVHVENGTYVENLIVDKPLHLIGQSQAGAKIVPAISGANPGGGGSLPPGSSSIILVRADNVEITQLTLDGDNTLLTSGIVLNGADLDARNGIITDHTFVALVLNLDVHDVTVNNIYLRGIYPSTVGGTFTIVDNTLDNIGGDPGSVAIFVWAGSGLIDGNTISRAADAISTNHSMGTTMTDNTITLSGSGVHSDNNGDSGGVADVIQNNTVSNATAAGYGVFVFAPYLPITVSGNTIFDVNVGMAAFGSGTGTPLVTFTNNNVDINGRANSAGVYVLAANIGFGDEDVAASLNGNTIKGAEAGVLIEGTTKAATASLTNNQIYGNDVGVYVYKGATASLTTTDFDDAVDNDTDLYIDSTAGAVTIGAASNNQFAGDDYYIDNRSTQAFNLVGTGSTYEAYNTAVLADNFRIEDRMYHALDDAASGRITVVAANRYVTTPGTGLSDETIQRAVDAADAADTVHVEAGSFAEDVSVPKTLTIIGAGAGSTNVTGGGTGFTVSGAGSITLSSLTVANPTGFAGGNVTQLKLDNLSVTSASGGSLANVGTLWVVSTAATGGVYTIGANTFQRTTELPISQFTYSGVTKLLVDAGTGVDTINVEGLGATSATLNAGDGYDAFTLGSAAAGLDDIGGKLTLNGQSAKASISVDDVNSSRTGSTTYILTGATFLRTAMPTVTFANVNSFALSAESKAGFTNDIKVSQTVAAGGMPVSIVGGALANNILTSPKMALMLWNVTGGNAGNFQAPGSSKVTFVQVQNLVGSAGNDSFTYTAGGAVSTINGNVGFDTINAGALAATNFALSGLNTGSATGGLTLSSFSGIENLMGSTAGDDTFAFTTPTAAVSGVLNGQGGLADWLDFSGAGATGITANLTASSASKTGGITNIENVAGSAGPDVLFGNAANNVLLGQGGNDRLSGGDGKDMLVGGSGIDLLDGGNNSDVLYGGNTGRTLLQLAADLAAFDSVGLSALASFAGSLVDDGAVDRLYSGAGNDVIYWRSSGAFADLLVDFAVGDTSINV